MSVELNGTEIILKYKLIQKLFISIFIILLIGYYHKILKEKSLFIHDIYLKINYTELLII